METVGYSAEGAFRLILTALVGVAVARHLGPEGLGLLSYANTVFALLVPVALLGMHPVLVREFSTVDDWRTVLASALGRQLPATVLSALVGFLVVAATRSWDSDAVLIALALAPMPVLATGETLRALFEATGRLRLVASVSVGAAIAGSLLKLLAILIEAPIWVFAAATSFDLAIVVAGLLIGVHRQTASIAWLRSYNREVAGKLLRESWPMIIAGVAVLLYMRVDVVMLGLLADDEVTGVYVAAARISEVWYFLPVAASRAIRPRLARVFVEEGHSHYDTVTQRFMSVAFAVSLGAVVATLVAGSSLIRIVYGAAFSGASDVLRVHILAAPFVFLGVAAGQWFIDHGMTRYVMLRSVLGAAINILMNLVLIPRYGAMGAATATLVSYALSSVLLNATSSRARPVFAMQMGALIFKTRR